MALFDAAIFDSKIFDTGDPEASAGGGGAIFHVGRHRTKEEIREERERLGILPQPVQAIVRQIIEDPEPIEALRQALEHEKLAYKAAYAEALLREIRIRQSDEELVLALLMH